MFDHIVKSVSEGIKGSTSAFTCSIGVWVKRSRKRDEEELVANKTAQDGIN